MSVILLIVFVLNKVGGGEFILPIIKIIKIGDVEIDISLAKFLVT